MAILNSNVTLPEGITFYLPKVSFLKNAHLHVLQAPWIPSFAGFVRESFKHRLRLVLHGAVVEELQIFLKTWFQLQDPSRKTNRKTGCDLGPQINARLGPMPWWCPPMLGNPTMADFSKRQKKKPSVRMTLILICIHCLYIYIYTYNIHI